MIISEGIFLTDRIVSVNGESNVSVNASWTPISNGTSNVSVLIDPLHTITESSKDNNRADMSVFVLPENATTATNMPHQPAPGGETTTTINSSCVMPGNGPPCNVVALKWSPA